MAKNKIQRAGYDDSGQLIDTKTPEAQPEKAPETKARKDGEEVAPRKSPEVAAMLRELIRDPAMLREVFHAAAQDPHLRQMLDLKAGQGPPSGVVDLSWQNTPSNHVPGGLERVSAPGTIPRPPSYITMWLAEDGSKTDYKDLSQVPPELHDTVKVAAIDAYGNHVKTTEYKEYIDKWNEGSRLGGKVQTDIQVGTYNADGGGTNVGNISSEENQGVSYGDYVAR